MKKLLALALILLMFLSGSLDWFIGEVCDTTILRFSHHPNVRVVDTTTVTHEACLFLFNLWYDGSVIHRPQ